MRDRLRALLLPALLVLGLLVQGLGMPAMAAPVMAASCQTVDGTCAKSGIDHHAMTGMCQTTCPVPVALPDVTAGAALMQAPVRFAMTGPGLPAGLVRTPDPFPPRPLRSA